ncbi:MAG: phosphoribosylformylglycinamidine synthase subunit PurS [Firmicutes bacterium]|nr:phosphoribosylformylglycinamidine synthase subunit PurS [Bacillota bacterium]
MRCKASVVVKLRKGVLDPQGAAVEGALRSMGYADAAGVRVGKCFEFGLEAASLDEARNRAVEISRRILANPVLEDFTVEVQPVVD